MSSYGFMQTSEARAPTARLLTRMPGDKKSALTTIL